MQGVGRLAVENLGKEEGMSEESIQNNEFENLSEEAKAEVPAHTSPEEHSDADSSSLSLDDLDSVAGGRGGGKRLVPRRHKRHN